MFKRVIHAIVTDRLCLFIICFGAFGLIMWQVRNFALWAINSDNYWAFIPYFIVGMWICYRLDRAKSRRW